MTPGKTVVNKVCFKSEDISHATQSLIAASSILHAIHEDLKHRGQVNFGSVVHVRNVIDEVIERLGLADLAVQQGELPF